MAERISLLIAMMLFAVCMNSMAEGKTWVKPYANNMSAETLFHAAISRQDTTYGMFLCSGYII